jgi:hypothetical protein
MQQSLPQLAQQRHKTYFILPPQYYGLKPVDGVIRGSGHAKLVPANAGIVTRGYLFNAFSLKVY